MSEQARPRSRRLRVLLAKMGLDGHDRGAKVVARTLRDSGHEVIYLGRRQPVAVIVDAAVQEDVDVIGLSVLSGTHMSLVPELVTACADAGLDVPIVVGGTILRREIGPLLDMGVYRIFPVGSPLQEIRDCFAELAESLQASVAGAE